MSKLEELIQEHCSSGVLFKRIDELCTISRGIVISKDEINNNPGEFPVYSSQTENNGELGKIDTYKYDGEFITWTTDGANAGTVFFRNGKFNITNVCGLLNVIDKDKLLTKYLYYALSIEAPKYVNKGMGNPKLMSNVMARIQVPLPALPVQREIVRILDEFSLLSAELAAELAARKQQYEFFRHKLINDENAIYKSKKLSEVAVLNRGIRVVKNQLHDNGYPVYQNSMTPLGYYDKTNVAGNTTFVIAAGAAGDIGFSNEKFWAADDCYYLYSDELNNKYIYYCLMDQLAKIKSMVRKASIPRISRASLENLFINVPNREKQDKIVATLDSFDSIINDISSGLPAEIQARQKQYEYYRDKLLRFDRKESI